MHHAPARPTRSRISYRKTLASLSLWSISLSLLLVLSACTARVARSPNPVIDEVCDHSIPPEQRLASFRTEMASTTRRILSASRGLRESTVHSTSHTPNLSSTSMDYPREPVIEWEAGDRFPSLRFPDSSSLRLDPILRSQNLSLISRIAIAPDQKRLALIAAHRGEHARTLVTIDRTANTWQRYDLTAYDVVWANPTELLVTTLENELPTRLYSIATNNTPRLMYEVSTAGASILLQRSRDGSHVFVTEVSPTAAHVRAYDPSNLTTPQFVLKDESPGVRCTSWRGSVVCLSFRTNPYGEIVRILPHNRRETLISGDTEAPCLTLDADHTELIAFCQRNAATTLQVLSPSSSTPQRIAALGPVTTLEPGPHGITADKATVRISSFLQPTHTRTLDGLRQDAPTTESLPYHEEALEAVSADGVRIPISLVRSTSPKALFIEAYGAYGAKARAVHSRLHSLLLERGVAIAVVHVRGGNERGPAWHTQAVGINKWHSIEDLRAAAETLQRRLTIPPSATFAAGRSAGGWLIAKTALTYPHMFGGIILEAPLLDLVAATTKPNTPLYHQELYEWGKDAAVQLSVLPLLDAAHIPIKVAALVPLRDTLVPHQEALQFALAARCTDPKTKNVFVMELPASGHAGANNREEERAWEDLQVALITASRDDAS